MIEVSDVQAQLTEPKKISERVFHHLPSDEHQSFNWRQSKRRVAVGAFCDRGGSDDVFGLREYSRLDPARGDRRRGSIGSTRGGSPPASKEEENEKAEG